MNYHIEGIFHAEYVEWWGCWRVYTDLTTEEIDSVEGTRVGRIGSDREFGRQVYIDPRFSEDKVLGELMELAQRKHSKSKCTCDPDPMIFILRSGDPRRIHYMDCPCHFKMYDPLEIKHTLCEYDLQRKKGEIKAITFRGKLYYLEGEVGPDYVAVKRGDLDDLEEALGCVEHDVRTLYRSKRVVKVLSRLHDIQNLLGDVINGDTEGEAGSERVAVKREDLEEWVEETNKMQDSATTVRQNRSLSEGTRNLLDSIIDSAFRTRWAIRGMLRR